MKTLITLFLITLLAANCNEPEPRKPMTQAEIDDRLLEVNKQMTMNEKAKIDDFVAEQKWPMETSGTGLRYWVYSDEPGQNAAKGQIAEVSFVVTLLDGTVCYQTLDEETRRFKVEGSDVESGLHEAIQLMSPGDKAKFILPSHLAHGLAGDMRKIPLKSAIIYDVTLYSLK